MGLKFILRERGKRRSVYNNYIYGEDTRSQKGVNWRCIYYSPPECCKAKV